MEAIGMYDFQATSEDELSFSKGQIVKVSSLKLDPHSPHQMSRSILYVSGQASCNCT